MRLIAINHFTALD